MKKTNPKKNDNNTNYHDGGKEQIEERRIEEELENDEGGIRTGGGRKEEEWKGKIVTVNVRPTNTIDIESGIIDIALHPIAIHAIDSTSISLQLLSTSSIQSNMNICKDRDQDEKKRNSYIEAQRLLAYGGAAGVLRVHSLNMVKEIIGR